MFASVIIPTRNAVDRLLYTLSSLNLQFAPFDEFEVIILNNGSTDGLKEKVKALQAHYPLRIVTSKFRCPMSRLLNKGIAQAHGDIIIFLGADLIVPRDFVGTHLQAHAQEERLVLVGCSTRRIYSVYYPTFTSRQQQECQEWLEHYPQIKRPHTTAEIIPLLGEKLVASELSREIALKSAVTARREKIVRKYGCRLNGYPSPWDFFSLNHASIKRRALNDVGLFRSRWGERRALGKEMGKRLWRANYSFQVAERLVLLDQERPPVL